MNRKKTLNYVSLSTIFWKLVFFGKIENLLGIDGLAKLALNC